MKVRWSQQQIWDWYKSKSWIMGVNYVPSITLHAMELWQKDTHAVVMESVRKELKLMQEIGMNSIRMFLPFHVWYHDRETFLDRMESVLSEFAQYGVVMMPVLFNDCVGFGKPEEITPVSAHGWHKYDVGHHGGSKSNPFTGEKEKKGRIYWDEEEWRPVMEQYLRSVIMRFRKNPDILIWDLWNEPGNSNRHGMSIPYLKRAFEIARGLDPIQPLTAGVWQYPDDYGINPQSELEPIQRLALDLSDIVTFHQYENFEHVKQVVKKLKQENRPLMNTEWLNRIQDNFIKDNLPFYYDEGIGSYSWGFVAGKSQHFLPWDELWQNRTLPLNRWQHDLFDTFYTPYDEEEIDLMRFYGKNKTK